MLPTPLNASSKSLLERELRDQGAVLSRRAPEGWSAAERAAAVLSQPTVRYLIIAARGSSDNAARFAQYRLGAEANLNVALAAPSLYADADSSPDLAGAAVLGISQSGQSPDIVAVLAAARARGRPTIALTNHPDSPLAAEADVVVPMGAGAELSVAATKTYIASLHAFEQIVLCLRPQPERRRWLDRLPDLVDVAVEHQLANRASFDVLGDASVVTAVGRGLDFSTAHETALKIRELSGMLTEAFSPADLLHGPIAAIRPPAHLWLIQAGSTGGTPMTTLVERARTDSLFCVVVSPRPPADGIRALHVPIPDAPASIAAILALIPGQVAALRLAETRGLDVDRPSGLTKVTLTR